MVYCNQRNNNNDDDDDDDKFLILFTIDRVNLPKRGLQSILYLLI